MLLISDLGASICGVLENQLGAYQVRFHDKADKGMGSTKSESISDIILSVSGPSVGKLASLISHAPSLP